MDLNAHGFFGQAATNNNANASASAIGSVTGSNRPQRRMHPIRPVTIKQLLEAQRVGEGVMVVDGREVTQATVVGRVIGYEDETANRLTGAVTAKHYGYRITDGTGLVVVRQWMESEHQEEPLPVQCYVRVSGTVKVWQNAPIVTGTVRLVSDCNELNYHYLDAILTHLRLSKGNKHAKDEAAVPAVSNTASTLGVQNMLPGGEGKVFATDVLLNAIKQNARSDVGLTMDELTAAARQYGFSVNDVRVALRTLAAEGSVYQTHDNRFNI
ncbi:replication Factor A 28 kDa subunit [Trypanosoma rangeli]|uniref:Replication Factor A 28 kDa subunit n=1 Tax=Trypanosoma rangeli TaxID=5698 RepID=A0A3S5IRR4_TRYRA|nr:replication Factor A 28 kDa subunit [Trypanosoma rangeli]RNF08346.1 replication Factor A 28 kDa subunit [Trypanosoma rangeli]|eukprot:RNF08346.1 replication Factor A 28 kDa subunit [Trypanosoma rangeli]